MIEGIEITIYLNDESISFDLSPTQTEVVFKALGIQFNNTNNTISSFGDNSLKKHILPKINFLPVNEKAT